MSNVTTTDCAKTKQSAKVAPWPHHVLICTLEKQLTVRREHTRHLEDPHIRRHDLPMLEELVNDLSLEYQGEGELRLQTGQEGPPEGPGQVRFALRYAPVEDGPPHTQAIKISLLGLDDEANEILGWHPGEGRRPLPHYDLSGTIEAEGERIPVRMEPVIVDFRLSRDMHSLFQADNAWKVTAGSGSRTIPTRVRALIPNLAIPEVHEFEAEGLRVRLSEAYPGAYNNFENPNPQDVCKVLPGSYLDLECPEGAEENTVLLAIEVFGWLLTFYQGRAVHPIAWEGETEEGPVWCIHAQDVTPLPVEERDPCLRPGNLRRFLEGAFRAWLARNGTERLRLKCAINSYKEILAAPFATQQIALTAVYLERFRELFVGSSELLRESKTRRENVAKEMTEALKETINSSSRLEPAEKDLLSNSIDTNRGKVKDLLRKTFRESLLELYDRADLEVDEGELGEFIAERNRVIHGTYDASAEGAWKTDRLARYGLSLLEKLLLRLLRYEGEYYDRANGERVWLPEGHPSL